MSDTILVVQKYGIGNGILTTPLVRALRSLGHRVSVLVDKGRGTEQIFGRMPEVFRVYDGGSANRLPRTDWIVYGHPASRPLVDHRAWICVPAIGESTDKTARGYMFAWPKHEAEVLVDLARSLGFCGTEPELFIPFPRAAPRVPADSVAVGLGYLKRQFWEGKHWGTRNYIQLVRALERTGRHVVLVGGPGDREDGRAVAAATRATDLVGRLSLVRTFGVLRRCAGFVGNDTGLMHAAAACRIPTLGIFMISNPVKSRPWAPPGSAHEKLMGFMQEPTVDEALEALLSLLDQASAGPGARG